MKRLANLADGGAQLAALLGTPTPGAAVLAIIPNGVPAAEIIAREKDLSLLGVRLDRMDVPAVIDLPDLTGRPVIVVDDGVETGTAARLVGTALREQGAGPLTLAVAICPREAEATLAQIYHTIVAVERPFVRRDLRWHYVDFDTISESDALRRIGQSSRSLE